LSLTGLDRKTYSMIKSMLKRLLFAGLYIIMIQNLLIAFLILVLITLAKEPIPFAVHQVYSAKGQMLSEHSMSLQERYPNAAINTVFKDNILLNFSYLSGKVTDGSNINWNDVHATGTYEVVLKPGEVFAYHDDVLAQYQGKVVKTTNAHFNVSEGFKSDGYLVGDGVCHFASLITWAARDAGLSVVAPTNHDFANIPQVPKEHGTSIYYAPGQPSVNQMQNLYVENTTDRPVRLVFNYANDNLSVAVYE
jgi:hypothetical protein